MRVARDGRKRRGGAAELVSSLPCDLKSRTGRGRDQCDDIMLGD